MPIFENVLFLEYAKKRFVNLAQPFFCQPFFSKNKISDIFKKRQYKALHTHYLRMRTELINASQASPHTHYLRMRTELINASHSFRSVRIPMNEKGYKKALEHKCSGLSVSFSFADNSVLEYPPYGENGTVACIGNDNTGL